jgi:hypothetical protein
MHRKALTPVECRICGKLVRGGFAMHERTHIPGRREALFWAMVEKRGPDECWQWKGAIKRGHKSGYGAVSWAGRHLAAHRAAWILLHGEPGELCVLHKCDNRECVNPNHLFLGTKQDNADDKVAKGRQCVGPMNGRAKLTDDLVRQIKAEHCGTKKRNNTKALAAKYGVTPWTIARVIYGGGWAHVK